MVFPVAIYGCESSFKKDECWRIDVFELWYWRILLTVLWTVRWPNQSILKEINPEYSLEGLMLKVHYLDTWFKSWLTGKDPDARKIEDTRRGRQRKRWLDGITDSMDMSLSKLWEIVKDRKSWCAIVHRVTKGQTWLNDWATTSSIWKLLLFYPTSASPLFCSRWNWL